MVAGLDAVEGIMQEMEEQVTCRSNTSVGRRHSHSNSSSSIADPL